MTSVSPGQPGYAGHNNPHEPETHISKIRYAKAGKDYDPMVLLSQRTLELPPQNYNLRQYTAPPPWQLAGTGGYKARRRLGPRLCVHAAQAHRRCLPCARLGRPQGPKREIPASRQTEANAGVYGRAGGVRDSREDLRRVLDEQVAAAAPAPPRPVQLARAGPPPPPRWRSHSGAQ
jgi:hypothetical protein